MEPGINQALILIVYVSILVELTLLHVPSVASTYQLFFYSDKTDNGPLMVRVKRWPAWIKIPLLFIPTLISIILYLLPLLFVFLPVSQSWFNVIHVGVSVQYAGWGIVIIGRILAIFSVLQIRKSNSQLGNQFSLKTKGLFRLSRNPILLGMYITYLGWLVLFPNWIMGLGFIVYFVNMHFRILLEEDFLQQKFGDNFKNYLQGTNRYF